MNNALIEEAKHWSKEQLAKQLTLAFESMLGRVEVVDKVAVYPLIMRHVDQYVQSGLALIGDAAHTMHPLAGQGVNMGLLDAAALLEIIENALSQRKNYADYYILRRYERWREGENNLMLNAMQLFKQLFGKQPLPLVMLRNLGLNCTDRLPFIKQFFINRAMGLSGDLSKWVL